MEPTWKREFKTLYRIEKYDNLLSKNVFNEHALVFLVEYFLASVMLSQKHFTLLAQ